MFNVSNILAFSSEFDFGLNRVLAKTNLPLDKLHDQTGIDIPNLNKQSILFFFFRYMNMKSAAQQIEEPVNTFST
jgi:hypothetical protein